MQGMIFSAGLGTRFKPWTDEHPKALAPVNGKSLLQRNVEYLAEYGVRDLVVNVHHFASQVEDAIKESKGWGSRITISDERDALLDTGGGLLKAKPHFKKGERFITVNADILTDLDIGRLIAFHERQKALVSFGISRRETSRYLLFDEENRLCGWRNKKTGEEIIAYTSPNPVERAYSCVAVFEYDFFEQLSLTGKFSLIDAYLALAPAHRIMGFHHDGDRWVDVGKPGSVEEAAKLFP